MFSSKSRCSHNKMLCFLCLGSLFFKSHFNLFLIRFLKQQQIFYRKSSQCLQPLSQPFNDHSTCFTQVLVINSLHSVLTFSCNFISDIFVFHQKIFLSWYFFLPLIESVFIHIKRRNSFLITPGSDLKIQLGRVSVYCFGMNKYSFLSWGSKLIN